MLLPPSVNAFRDDCIHELDLQRFREFLFEQCASSTVLATAAPATSNVLLDVVMRGGEEGNEQDLEPFDQTLLKPLQSLPPGKLPGINFDLETAQKIPSSIFSLSIANTGTNTNVNSSSSGNSPKRRKIDPQQQQNVTIQHF